MARSLRDLAQEILFQKSQTHSDESFVVGISGTDGCGKGFIAGKIHQLLKEEGKSVALIHIDG